FATIRQHIFGHAAPTDERGIHVCANRIDVACPLVSGGVGWRGAIPSGYHLQIGGADADRTRANAHLPLPRFGLGIIQPHQLIRSPVSNRLHWLMMILLRSGDPITSTALCISDSGKQWEMMRSVLTSPVSIRRMALLIASGLVPKLASMRPSRKCVGPPS